MAFKPAMNVLAGESVNFNMAGFTNGNFTGLTHKVWSVVRTVCVGKGGCNDDTLTIVEAASEVSRAEEALLPLLRRISTAFVHTAAPLCSHMCMPPS